jgi:hypothetical protein
MPTGTCAENLNGASSQVEATVSQLPRAKEDQKKKKMHCATPPSLFKYFPFLFIIRGRTPSPQVRARRKADEEVAHLFECHLA